MTAPKHEVRSDVPLTTGATEDGRIAVEVGDVLTVYLTDEQAWDLRSNLYEALKTLKDEHFRRLHLMSEATSEERLIEDLRIKIAEMKAPLRKLVDVYLAAVSWGSAHCTKDCKAGPEHFQDCDRTRSDRALIDAIKAVGPLYPVRDKESKERANG